MRQAFIVQNVESEKLLESFLISAVASLLAIRVFLELTGYPILGGQGLHIAHMLWGGLFMMAAIILMLSFLGRDVKHLAAIIGGIGFGAFIDELGKFITHDNNYFFQPTIAIIYVIFVLLYFLIEAFKKFINISKETAIINALGFIKEALHHELDEKEKKEALNLLKKANGKDPIVKGVKQLLKHLDAAPAKENSIIGNAMKRLHDVYLWLIAKRWFKRAVVGFFVANSLIVLWSATSVAVGLRNLVFAGIVIAYLAYDIARKKNTTSSIAVKACIALAAAYIGWQALPILSTPALAIMEWGEMLSSSAAGLFTLAGIWHIRKSRLKAYKLFKYSILIVILLNQFFVFYREQLSAVVGLFGYIIIIMVLQYMIDEESRIKPNKIYK